MRLRARIDDARLIDAGPSINRLRRIKSDAEIALMQHAKTITLEVHRRAWTSLKEGVMASEIARFIDNEHRALGAGAGSSFCIVAFGEDTSLPHGPDADRALKKGDVVLIDTGCRIDGYNSDITRTYVFGEPTAELMEATARAHQSVSRTAFSPDPEQRWLYVLERSAHRLVVLDRATLRELTRFGQHGDEVGEMYVVHDMTADSQGNLYTVEVIPIGGTRKRTQKWVLTGVAPM